MQIWEGNKRGAVVKVRGLTEQRLQRWSQWVPWWWRPVWYGWRWGSACRSSQLRGRQRKWISRRSMNTRLKLNHKTGKEMMWKEQDSKLLGRQEPQTESCRASKLDQCWRNECWPYRRSCWRCPWRSSWHSAHWWRTPSWPGRWCWPGQTPGSSSARRHQCHHRCPWILWR